MAARDATLRMHCIRNDVESVQLMITPWDEIKTVFDRAAAEIGDVPIVVANDGDVSALAGAMGMNVGSIMGMAMGTIDEALEMNKQIQKMEVDVLTAMTGI